ncbi:MAG: hypothetical protein HY314_07785 [Acidobacteria bacterium]|nr:hypothetical protein [Acidobacteriota bacterium]
MLAVLIRSLPANPNNLVVGANEAGRQGFYSSTNGGRSWRNGQISQPSGFRFGSDPGIAADAQGNFYFSFIAFNRASDGTLTDSGVFVAKSINRGQSFRPPVAIVQHLRESNSDFEDKPFVAVDANPVGPSANTLYVSWTSFISGVPPNTKAQW